MLRQSTTKNKRIQEDVSKTRTEKLVGLFAASDLFRSKASNPGSLASMARQVALAMETEFCVLACLDHSGSLKPLSTHGLNGLTDLIKVLADDKKLFKWVLRYRRPFTMRGREKELHRYLPDSFSNLKIISCLVIPLIVHGEVIGLIGLFDRRPERFNESDRSLLTLFSTHIAMTLKNFEMFSRIKSDFLQTVKAFASIVDFNDTYTHGHSERVMNYAAFVCDQYPLSQEEKENILYGSFLHDIGKIGVHTSILRKPGKLSPLEWEQMVSHVDIGAEIVSQIESLKPLAPYILYHHTWYSGGGYPDPEMQGEQIPLGARILSVADAYEAMTSDRPYRRAMDHETAAKQLRRFCKIQFDPDVVEAFLSAMD